MFRLIAVVYEGDGAADHPAKDDQPAVGTVEATSRWFHRLRLTLGPGEITPWSSTASTLVAVQIGDGQFTIERRRGGEG